MATYILQKECVGLKKGMQFTNDKHGDPNIYVPVGALYETVQFDRKYVENNEEWFKLKEERIVISELHALYTCEENSKKCIDENGKFLYSFKSSHNLVETKNSAIIKAIEFVANNNNDV